MTAVLRIQTYLARAGLEAILSSVPLIEKNVQGVLAALGSLPDDVDLAALYRYSVPELSEDGACSLVETLAPVPYDLALTLGGVHEATTRKLWLLGQLVEHAAQSTGADWLGVYQARRRAGGARALVKLAYRGRPSRAEFPLTQAFAAGSTNSTVGLSGQAKVIDDVAGYRAAGGGFYVCDDAVQSEACVPLFDEAGQVVGIIDAEAQAIGFFHPERLCMVVAAALVAPSLLPS